jgi:DNA-directed RNA polymerase specialized sigma24 family protein
MPYDGKFNRSGSGIPMQIAMLVGLVLLFGLWRAARKPGAHHMRKGSQVGAYIFGSGMILACAITHRRAVEVVRREQACLERDSRHHREMTALGRDSVEELILRRVEDEKILGSLSMLSRAQSKAITLGYLDGQTYAEVAGSLNLSLPAVKSRIRDGFRNLRQSLGPEGAGSESP